MIQRQGLAVAAAAIETKSGSRTALLRLSSTPDSLLQFRLHFGRQQYDDCQNDDRVNAEAELLAFKAHWSKSPFLP